MKLALAIFALALLTVASASGASSLKGPQHHKATRSVAVALAADPDHVSFGLLGCKNDGTIVLPIAGKFVCPDAAYTNGNLGPGWNELDLVPFRTTADAGNSAPATQTYSFANALDSIDGGKPGFDVISSPVLNTSLSSGTCTAATDGGQQVMSPGTGGINTTIYRLWTVTQPKNTHCVYDWYGRLAVGSHLWPGSSLHADLLNQSLTTAGIGAKENSIPVKDISPQAISKTMTAQRDTDHTWNVTKSSNPANLNFGNVCSNTFSSTKNVAITVTWTKGAATPSGQTSITANIYATNPASREITISIEDKVYAGTTQTTLLHTGNFGPTVLAPNSTTLVGTDTFLTSDTSTQFNDVATGSYVDTVTNVAIPDHTTATATATVTTGSTSNDSATITDTESITTGKGLKFKVATPSAGSFVAPSEAGALLAYVAGTDTVGPVNWSSGSQSSGGSVTFNKTVTMNPISVLGVGDASLSDTATLTGSSGFSASFGPLSVGITSTATTSLTITKTIPNVLQDAETATFQFHVAPSGGGASVADPTISFAAGDTSKSTTVTGLAPGTYTVTEDTLSGWNPQSSQGADLTLPSHCSNSVTFNNSLVNATASARKITDPAVDETNANAPYNQGWTFTLTRPDASTLTGTTDSSGNIVWSGGVSTTTALALEGTYTIGETSQTGWTETGAADDGGTGTVTGGATTCSFTVSYPADAGKTFKCKITNQSRGNVRVHKTVNGLPLSGSQAFVFKVLKDASSGAAGTQVGSNLTANAGNSGTVTFTGLVPGVHYAICEQLQAGFGPNFDPSFGPFNPNNDANWLCEPFSFQPADTVNNPALTFEVDNSHATAGALTIGYWKNHANPECKKSKGKQADALSQYLGGITLGTITFNSGTSYWECQAVQTLSKNTFGGVKSASDPLFNMAAQLLAYYLNLNQGAGTCPAASTAASDGQALLVKYGWNGNTYSPALTSADATAANNAAAALDSYNNNNLC